MSFFRAGSSILRRSSQNFPAREYSVSPSPSSSAGERVMKTLRKLNSVPESGTLMLILGSFIHLVSAVSGFGVVGFYWYLRSNPDNTVMFNVKGIKVVKGQGDAWRSQQ